ncbi:MAG: PHB depolymerase family esterase [Casimicrobiaceae bacterium]
MVKPLQSWARSLQRIAQRNVASLTRNNVRSGRRAVVQALTPALDKHKPPPGAGDWLMGVALGLAGARRYRLYRPPGMKFGERLPLMVMLHGCGQDAKSFALSTRMNRIAARERFLVLYPEQDRMANAQGCWNWFDTKSGRAHGEAALIMKAIDQVCLLYAADRTRVAAAGLSAGASMAALLVARHPERFKAVMMHSGIPPGTAHSTLSAIGAMHGLRGTTALPAAPQAMVASWPPLLVIHGSDDRVVSVNNGRAAAQVWAEVGGARPGDPRSVHRGKRHATTVTDYQHRRRSAATLVEVNHLGHAWSGGAPKQPFSDSEGPDASRMIWAFAAKQFRPGA